MIIGIITARGGSKGLPGKNMLDLGEFPLIEHTFMTAQAVEGIDRVLLSTNIPEAISLAHAKYPKIEVPYVRPAELCSDTTSQVDVVNHLLDHLKAHEGSDPSVLVLFQPTSPFRRVQEIENAIQAFRGNRVQSMVGVTRVLHHPADYMYRPKEGDQTFQWVMRSPEWSRRQDFPQVYFNTGALYICTTEYFRREQAFYDQGSQLFEMAEESALDIDNAFDLQLARGWWATSKQHGQ